MKNILGYLAAVAATIFFSILYNSPVLTAFVAAEILLPLLLGLPFYLAARKVKFTFYIPIPVAEAGSDIRASLLVENKSRLPFTEIDAVVEYRNLFLPEHNRLHIKGGVDAKSSACFTCMVESQICGCMEFSVKKVRIYDYLHLFFLPRRVRNREQAVVLPYTYETTAQISLRTREFAGDSEEYDAHRGGDDTSEIFQLREYRPGDRIQQVHWKLSAASDDLTVKEFGHPINCPVVLFLDFHRIPGEPLWMKGFPELAAAISRALVEADCLHYVAWYEAKSQQICRLRVGSHDDVYQWLQQFLHLCPYDEIVDLPELYGQTHPWEPYETALAVTLDRRVFRQGELIAGFPAETMKEMLAQWEVLV